MITDKLLRALEREREIAGHLMVDNPHPQIWKELLEAQAYTNCIKDTLAGTTTKRSGDIAAVVEERERCAQIALVFGYELYDETDDEFFYEPGPGGHSVRSYVIEAAEAIAAAIRDTPNEERMK